MYHRKVHVLGLCPESPFDRVYHYTVDEEGRPFYLGLTTSHLLFNEVKYIEGIFVGDELVDTFNYLIM